MKVIDLRSDTITEPTPEMRKAMFEAEVGDDVYGEDPTVNKLETIAAEMMGKEAAIFTSSGTQSNLVAIMTSTHHGDEIILGDNAHIFWYEVGGASSIAGVVMHIIPNQANGTFNLTDVEQAIRGNNIHFPETTLLCLENTQNRCGGAVLPLDFTKQVCNLAHSRGIKVYLDGARIFNASVASGLPVKNLVEDVDSVSFCLSKGLSAPVGSLLCGSRAFIDKARKFRKMLGGGMRQAGIIAAAGIVALETMIDRLAVDHANAKKLARGLAGINGINVANPDVPTNIVIFNLSLKLQPEAFLSDLLKAGVKLSSLSANKFRAVTNRMVSTSDIDEAISNIETLVNKSLKF
jgi:threonine aldolase